MIFELHLFYSILFYQLFYTYYTILQTILSILCFTTIFMAKRYRGDPVFQQEPFVVVWRHGQFPHCQGFDLMIKRPKGCRVCIMFSLIKKAFQKIVKLNVLLNNAFLNSFEFFDLENFPVIPVFLIIFKDDQLLHGICFCPKSNKLQEHITI